MFVFRSPEQWARGLVGCTPEQAQEGALFVMPSASPWPVTSDGLDFPVDVFWLSESGMVLEHGELFPGQGVCWPDVAAKFVLELPMSRLPEEGAPPYRVGDFVEVNL